MFLKVCFCKLNVSLPLLSLATILKLLASVDNNFGSLPTAMYLSLLINILENQ